MVTAEEWIEFQKIAKEIRDVLKDIREISLPAKKIPTHLAWVPPDWTISGSITNGNFQDIDLGTHEGGYLRAVSYGFHPTRIHFNPPMDPSSSFPGVWGERGRMFTINGYEHNLFFIHKTITMIRISNHSGFGNHISLEWWSLNSLKEVGW
ncbi:MAG: hypothetical protein N2315_08845 [Thermanaerothrix sp.]|nr:hypothetical protein [Thermanaerothrix sp.]